MNGRFPKNQNEILISETINSNGKLKLKIGDKLSLDIGERKTLDRI